MNDKRSADLMARQLLAIRAVVTSTRAQLDAMEAQIDSALEVVAGMQEVAALRMAASTVQGGADENAADEVPGRRTFGRGRATAGQHTVRVDRDGTGSPSAPQLAPIPTSVTDRLTTSGGGEAGSLLHEGLHDA